MLENSIAPSTGIVRIVDQLLVYIGALLEANDPSLRQYLKRSR